MRLRRDDDVPKSRIEGIYGMYRRVEAVNKLGPDGILIRLQNTQDDPCTVARQLRQIIDFRDQEIDKLREDCVLLLVAKCVEFYGTNVIVREPQNLYPHDETIQNFRGWAACSAYVYQSNDGQWLQHDIDNIKKQNPYISAVWDTLQYIRNPAQRGCSWANN